VVFTSDGRQYKEVDARISTANTVLRRLYRFMFTKQELLNTAKLSFIKSIFVPKLTYGHKSCARTEGVLSQVQAAETGFLRRIHGVTLHDKVHSCEIREALTIDPILRNRRDLSNADTILGTGHVTRTSQGGLARRVNRTPVGHIQGKAAQVCRISSQAISVCFGGTLRFGGTPVEKHWSSPSHR